MYRVKWCTKCSLISDKHRKLLLVHGQSDLENPRMLAPSTYKHYRVIMMLTFLVEGYKNRLKLENLTLIFESICHMISEIHFETERCK